MKKRAKHAPKSLSSSEISIRVVIAGVLLLLFFLVAFFVNHWYLYSHFNTPENILTASSGESSPNPAQEDSLPKGEADPDLTFYDRLTRQEPLDSGELSVPSPSHNRTSPAAPSPPQSLPQSDQINSPVSPPIESAPAMKEDISEEFSYTIQVGSFQSLAHAERILSLLNQQGFEAAIAPVNLSKDKTWYRVRIGKFPLRDDADKIAQKLKENGNFQPLIMPLKKSP